MGRQRRNTVNRSFNNEIYGIILIAISLIASISIYINPLGYAGVIIKNFFMGMAGIGAYLLPVILFILGFALITKQGRIKIKQRFAALCLLIYTILLTINVYYSFENIKLSIIDRLIKSYETGCHAKGGGVISEIIDLPLIYIFGRVGTYIVLACLMLIFIILATEVSLGEIINRTVSNIKVKKREKKQKKELITDANEEKHENPVIPPDISQEKSNMEENIDNIDKKIKILDFMKDGSARDGEKESAVSSASSTMDISSEISKNKNDRPLMNYTVPPIDLLQENKNKTNVQDKKELLTNAKILEETLESFGVDAKVVQVSRGPAVTRYELHPSPGVKVSRIVSLSDDIALNLAAPMVRIEAPIPGKAAVGIEVPNKEVVPVTLREVIESNEFTEYNSRLAFALGKDISGKCMVADIASMPHLLIAGATGSGKSVCINTLITSLIYKSSPTDVKMLLIDPKVVELSVYNGIPHLLIPVVTDPKKAATALIWAVNEMNQRYKLFADNNVRNIESYNKLMDANSPDLKLPKIVIIIDELADLMMAAPNEVEDSICRLAQMARAAGMHLIIATQRPSVDVITGLIKANIPSRISFAVSSQVDSRTILDMSGAEKLLGKGDMLFLPIGENKPVRIQGAFISEKEVEKIVSFLKKSTDTNYDNDIIDEIENKEDEKIQNEDVDELLPEAIKTAVDYGQVSASMLQRRLRIGFNRAARIVEQMEARGIVGPQEGSKPRQVLISKEEYENNF